MISPNRLLPIHAAVVATALCASVPATAQDTGPVDLELRRVMMSTGGVAYFEYEATVENDAELRLDLRLDQVDDVLKSVVVFDGQGSVGEIRLPGRDALDQIYRDLPFDADALRSPAALFNALRGAEVSAVGVRELAGRLISVEPEITALPDNMGTVTRHRVSLMTATGLEQFILEDAGSVRFVDARLQGQVDQALAAISAHRARDRREMRITVQGDGRRAVRVGYVAAAPLWKTSYRLTVEAGATSPSATGRLQGWAIVENMSGQDWHDVELTLLSGNPVTFRQPLYTAYYVPRPEVPVEVFGRVLPRPDSGGVSLEVALGEEQELRRAGRAFERAEAGALADMDMMAAPAEPAMAPPPPRMAQPAVAAQRQEATTQVVFRIAQPVSITAGQSASVPIVDVEVPAGQVALYQPQTHARHPLATVALTNESGTGLPPGVLTLYETDGSLAYVGDAQLAAFPVGEARMLSFAVDAKTRIDREDKSTRTIVSGAISRGSLRLRVREQANTVYVIKGPAREAREVVIEHPRRGGWDLIQPDADGVTLTDNHYRVPVSLEAGGEARLVIALGRTLTETVALVNMSRSQFLAYSRNGSLDQALRSTFKMLAEMRAEIDRLQQVLRDLEARRQVIYADQERIQNGLRNVPQGGDLFRRYIGKLEDQESELDDIAETEAETRDALAEAEAELADAIREIKI